MASTSAIDSPAEFSVWVPIYLPWSTGTDTEEHREVLRLSEEYRVWFDAETERQLQAVLDRCPELNDEVNWVTLMTHEDTDVRALATRRHQMALRRCFEPHDAQALDWQSRIAEAVRRENAGRFRCHPLCRPGVALEIRSPGGSIRYAVIGHADEHGDLSTPAIANDDVVTRVMDLMPMIEASGRGNNTRKTRDS